MWKITEYISHWYIIEIFDTSTCLKFHHNKSPKFLVDYKLIIPFDWISFEIYFPIYHDKFTQLENNCSELKNLFDKYFQKQSNEVLCENDSKKCQKHKVRRWKWSNNNTQTMVLLIIIQWTEYDYETYSSRKTKQKSPFHNNILYSFINKRKILFM